MGGERFGREKFLRGPRKGKSVEIYHRLSGADTKPPYYVSTCAFSLVSPQGLSATNRVARVQVPRSLPVDPYHVFFNPSFLPDDRQLLPDHSESGFFFVLLSCFLDSSGSLERHEGTREIALPINRVVRHASLFHGTVLQRLLGAQVVEIRGD